MGKNKDQGLPTKPSISHKIIAGTRRRSHEIITGFALLAGGAYACDQLEKKVDSPPPDPAMRVMSNDPSNISLSYNYRGFFSVSEFEAMHIQHIRSAEEDPAALIRSATALLIDLHEKGLKIPMAYTQSIEAPPEHKVEAAHEARYRHALSSLEKWAKNPQSPPPMHSIAQLASALKVTRYSIPHEEEVSDELLERGRGLSTLLSMLEAASNQAWRNTSPSTTPERSGFTR